MRKILRTILLALLAMGFLSGCGTTSKQLEQEDPKDAVLAIEIKSALIEDASIAAAAIRVEIDNSVVTLSGFVETVDQKATAGKIAKSAAGSLKVVNSLVVK